MIEKGVNYANPTAKNDFSATRVENLEQKEQKNVFYSLQRQGWKEEFIKRKMTTT